MWCLKIQNIYSGSCFLTNVHSLFTVVLKIAHRTGYIKINWKRMEKDMDKMTRKVEKQVEKMKKHEVDKRGIVAFANRVRTEALSEINT